MEKIPPVKQKLDPPKILLRIRPERRASRLSKTGWGRYRNSSPNATTPPESLLGKVGPARRSNGNFGFALRLESAGLDDRVFRPRDALLRARFALVLRRPESRLLGRARSTR